MMGRGVGSAGRGFTLIELLIAIVVVAVVLTIVAPSFHDFIVTQRLKAVNQQLVTDLQLARTEAVGRNARLRVAFGGDAGVTCYTLYTTTNGNATRCDCTLGVGAACSATGGTGTEVRTVQVERSLSVWIETPADVDPAFAFDPVTGGIVAVLSDTFVGPPNPFVIYTKASASRWLRTTVGTTGRPTVCGSSGNLGVASC
jgi:prepilin-type N-terminal cleavage/methylation domain-containing protein